VLQLVEELAASRFEEWAEAVRPSAADRNGLLGYRRHGEGCVQYWITPDGLRQLCSGHDPKEVAAEFARRGLLRCVGDKTAVSIAGPDGRKARFYHLRVAVAGPEKERTAATA
jgi:hypothetical protein